MHNAAEKDLFPGVHEIPIMNGGLLKKGEQPEFKWLVILTYYFRNFFGKYSYADLRNNIGFVVVKKLKVVSALRYSLKMTKIRWRLSFNTLNLKMQDSTHASPVLVVVEFPAAQSSLWKVNFNDLSP